MGWGFSQLIFVDLTDNYRHLCIFVLAVHSFIDEARVHLVKREDNFVGDVAWVGHLDDTKAIVFKDQIGNEVILEVIVEVANSCDVEELKVVFPADPEGAVVCVNVVDLLLCDVIPLWGAVRPVSFPFSPPVWVPYL